MNVRRLIGVYDADGTLAGELKYFIGARLGRAHCALCDITHGRVLEKPEWIRCRDELPMTFDTCHRDDQPDDVRACSQGRVPVIVADTDEGMVVLVRPDEIERCDGSPAALIDAIHDGLDALERGGRRP